MNWNFWFAWKWNPSLSRSPNWKQIIQLGHYFGGLSKSDDALRALHNILRNKNRGSIWMRKTRKNDGQHRAHRNYATELVKNVFSQRRMRKLPTKREKFGDGWFHQWYLSEFDVPWRETIPYIWRNQLRNASALISHGRRLRRNGKISITPSSVPFLYFFKARDMVRDNFYCSRIDMLKSWWARIKRTCILAWNFGNCPRRHSAALRPCGEIELPHALLPK